MSRWAEITGGSSGDQYQHRLDELAATGAAMHGEADFVTWLAGTNVRLLDAGCGTGRVAVELSLRGLDVVGVDCDSSMLTHARRARPDLSWVEGDLAGLAASDPELGGGFDLVLMAGNVVPLLSPGTEQEAVIRLAATLHPGGRVVAGFGLDVAHLPMDDVPVTLAEYDGWCCTAGLELEQRFSTWGREPYDDGAGYAVSVHRRAG